MRVQSHEPPQQNRNFLVKWDYVQALGEVGCICINDVLEILRKAFVEWVKIHPPMNNPQQPEELIRSQIFDYLLLELLVYFLLASITALHSSGLEHKVLEYLVQGNMSSSD